VPECNGIERRLERLKGCLLKLEPLKTKTSDPMSFAVLSVRCRPAPLHAASFWIDSVSQGPTCM